MCGCRFATSRHHNGTPRVRVLILGSGGMIGHQLTRAFIGEHEVWGTASGDSDDVVHFTGIERARVFSGFEALDTTQLTDVLDAAKPALVVNAIGLVKQSELISDVALTVAMNVTLPRTLSRMAAERGARFIHLSTDCVFSGDKGMYTELDRPDADDEYGRSKAQGEKDLGEALVIRTSAIGREIRHFHGLVEWLLGQPPGQVPGFSEAYWSGLPTVTFARLVAELAESAPDLTGLHHLTTNRINKYDLLGWLSAALGSRWTVVPTAEPALDRSLDGSRLVAASGIQIPEWPDLVDELIRDSRMHDELKAAR